MIDGKPMKEGGVYVSSTRAGVRARHGVLLLEGKECDPNASAVQGQEGALPASVRP